MKTKLLTIAMTAALMLTAMTKVQAQNFEGPCLPYAHGLNGHQSAFCGSTETQTISLVEGWNWVSTYIDTDEVDGMAMLMTALGDNATQIATFDDSAECFEGEWYWGSDGEHQLTNSNMVMVEVPEDCTVTLEGPAVTRTVEITINPGWNWIGFPFDTEMSFSAAMAGFNAENEDAFASSFDSNEYFEGMWYNTFETLVPGQGYMYYYNGTEPQTLVFSTTAGGKSVSLKKRKE